jgi:hypothetical protein
MSASLALQTALFAALAADAPVQAALGDPPRLYDSVPRAPVFPYATLGGATETDWSTKTEAGSEHRFTLTVWSRAPGHKESKDIAATLIDALDSASLTLDGHTLVSLRFEDATHTRETDGITTRATLRYRAVTEPH